MSRFLVKPAIPFFLVLFLASCNQTQNPDSGTPVETPAAQSSASSGMAPSPAAVPQPQQLTLYIVPMNPGEFSMDNIKANKERIEKDPEDIEALIALGNANFMIQRFEVTEDLLARAVKIDPKRLEVRLTLATSKILMRNVEGSLKELDDLLKIQGDHPEALYNKGLIQFQSVGDRTAAKETWTQLVQTHPEHNLSRQVQNVLAQL